MKIALVTGAAQRIGEGIAKKLLASNYQVILCANTSFAKLINWSEQNIYKKNILGLIQADLSTKEGQEKVCIETKKITSHLDLLVNNASLFYPKPFLEVSRKDYDDMQSVNAQAAFFLIQSLFNLLSAKGGCVVNILDALWDRPSINYSHYYASKASLAILTKSLAKELAPNIRVNAVSPGAILFQNFHTKAHREKTLSQIPQKRLGTTEEIAQAVFYLSDQASYITGHFLNVDGGRSI